MPFENAANCYDRIYGLSEILNPSFSSTGSMMFFSVESINLLFHHFSNGWKHLQLKLAFNFEDYRMAQGMYSLTQDCSKTSFAPFRAAHYI